MFGLNTGKCKRILLRTISKSFDPLKGELGNVPSAMNNSQYITGSMFGICEAFANNFGINKPQTIAMIIDAVFEDVFFGEATSVLKHVDNWKNNNEKEFMSAYDEAKKRTTQDAKQLNTEWLKEYAVKHFEPSRTLML